MEPAGGDEGLGDGDAVPRDVSLDGRDAHPELLQDRPARLARPQLRGLDIVREEMLDVAVSLVRQHIRVVVERVAAGLVVVDQPQPIRAQLREPDSRGVIPAQVPAGVHAQHWVHRERDDAPLCPGRLQHAGVDRPLDRGVERALVLLVVLGRPLVKARRPELGGGQDARLARPVQRREVILAELGRSHARVRVRDQDALAPGPHVRPAVHGVKEVAPLGRADLDVPLVGVPLLVHAGAIGIGQHGADLLGPHARGELGKLVLDAAVEVQAAQALLGAVDTVQADAGARTPLRGYPHGQLALLDQAPGYLLRERLQVAPGDILGLRVGGGQVGVAPVEERAQPRLLDQAAHAHDGLAKPAVHDEDVEALQFPIQLLLQGLQAKDALRGHGGLDVEVRG